MDYSNRRHFSRVNTQQEVNLDFGAKKYKHSVSNLSLSGMFVQGQSEQKTGDTCEIWLQRSVSEAKIKAAGRVVRVAEDGMALKFTFMPIDSFLFLQTLLQYEAGDSKLLAAQPVSRIAFEEDNALLLYN
ncbi:PilZ domain-containing protein [Candidatus Electronema sp. PJ]|uniref:PilZ domain-containing protein n=1 Tax=Candidatus Electronema sp. PJ TaxID=3401572 RepID=UPI003AA971A8